MALGAGVGSKCWEQVACETRRCYRRARRAGHGLGTRAMRRICMPKPPLPERVTILEQKVEILESLPERVTALELQIVQLRSEMHDEFSAIRGELRGGDARLREEIRAVDAGLREEIRSGDEETRRFMRVLHED